MAQTLHVFDLPQIHQKPSADALRQALEILEILPTSFRDSDAVTKSVVIEEGVPRYLTTIVGSNLSWMDEDEREVIWELASLRLTERSGRTAMGDMTRDFEVKLAESNVVAIRIHEPALIGDNLGFKTWSSAYVLANYLRHIPLSPELNSVLSDPTKVPKVLELGAGTGTVGVAAALLWSTQVALTDLPEIVGNLERNVNLNKDLLTEYISEAYPGILDWSKPDILELKTVEQVPAKYRFPIVLAADPIYSPDHPRMVIHAVETWLTRDPSALFILAYPIREAYTEAITSLRTMLVELGLHIDQEGQETSLDDWKDTVTHSLTVWKWKQPQHAIK